MKRIITLLVAAVPFVSVMAQSQTTEEAKRVILGERRGDSRDDYPESRSPKDIIMGRDVRNNYPSDYPSNGRNVDQVNRDYEAKIRSIRNNPNLTRTEKDRIIRDLELQRERRIREINGYSRNNDRDYRDRDYRDRDYRDRDYRNDDYYKKNKHKQKGNNGKHLGWEKGKGNPHKGRY